MSFLLTFSLLSLAFTLINLYVTRSSGLTEFIGIVALMLESTLAMPQLVQNYRNRSYHGLRWTTSPHNGNLIVIK